jgi:hypothetical protein
MLHFEDKAVESQYRQHLAWQWRKSDILCQNIVAIFAVVATLRVWQIHPPVPLAWKLFTPMLLLVNLAFWNLACQPKEVFTRYRDVLMAVQSLISCITGFASLHYMYVASDCSSLTSFIYSVLIMGGQWTFMFMRSFMYRVPYSMHLPLGSLMLGVVLGFNIHRKDIMFSQPGVRHQAEQFAHYLQGVTYWLPKPFHVSLDPGYTCIAVWSLLQILLGFVLPSQMLYRLEMASRKQYSASNMPDAVLNCYRWPFVLLAILTPVYIPLLWHRPDLIRYAAL